MLGQACAHCPIFPTAASRRSLDRISVPMWPITLSGRLLIVDLVSRYLTNYLIRREPTSYRISLTPVSCGTVVLCGISTCFQVLSPCMRQVAHALLTRSPLSYIRASSPATPFDLHVLSTPPAFVLSQDQTLVFNPYNLVFWFPSPTSKTHSRINCRSFLFLCIVFKVRCSLSSRPFGAVPQRA